MIPLTDEQKDLYTIKQLIVTGVKKNLMMIISVTNVMKIFISSTN